MSSSSGPLLVVDDDIDIREAIRDTLEQEGYTVAEARDGTEALHYLRSNPLPPLILLDWNMSPMNGPQFMAEFSKEPTFGSIPVVLLTADGRAEEKAKTNGYAGYLKKPVSLEDLFKIIGRYCQ
jgi:CheY-like chemotaxis protein